ncbi:MAG: hypothetical protein DSY89_10485 [Deltaproteobacteria bacterium]|nr:MAG: hypothetical protein DSY89_10485 [Deltaproteobacteria bacterium]
MVSPPVVRLQQQPASPVVADKGKKIKPEKNISDKQERAIKAPESGFKEEDIGPEVAPRGKKQAPSLKENNRDTSRQLEKSPGTNDRIQPAPATLYSVDKLIVHFEAYSEDLGKDITDKLEKFLLKTVKYPKAYLLIKGYTDSFGKAAANKQLSALRAEKVKAFFVDKGFDPTRIKAVGLGEADPIAPNDSLEGRNTNRRIEIELIHD